MNFVINKNKETRKSTCHKKIYKSIFTVIGDKPPNRQQRNDEYSQICSCNMYSSELSLLQYGHTGVPLNCIALY